MEWISVEKKKPKSGKDVMVYCPSLDKPHRVTMGKYWNKKDSGNGANWVVMNQGVFEGTDRNVVVTYWRPKPPKP